MGIRNTDEVINLQVRVGFVPPSLIDAAKVLDPDFIGSFITNGMRDNFPGEPAYDGPDDFEYTPAMDPNPPYEALQYTPPSNQAVYDQWKMMFDEYSQTAVYRLQRASEYPQLGEQLDALFHDLESGTLDATGKFVSLIKEVKDAYPKSV